RHRFRAQGVSGGCAAVCDCRRARAQRRLRGVLRRARHLEDAGLVPHRRRAAVSPSARKDRRRDHPVVVCAGLPAHARIRSHRAEAEQAMNVFLFCLIITLALLLAEPLWVLIGGATVSAYFIWGGAAGINAFDGMMERIRGLVNQQVLLAIPFFLVSG